MAYELNPYNSRTRADTHGIRPDMWEVFADNIVTKDYVANRADQALRDAETYTDQLDDLINPDIPNSRLWQTNQEVQKAQNRTLRAHQDQFTLHDNQLKWLSWTKHYYDFAFSLASGDTTRPGDTITSGLIDITLNTASGRGYEVAIRPGWRGRWRFEWTQHNGTATGSRSGWEDGTRTTARADVYEADKVIREGRLWVWPEYAVAPREWVVQVVEDDLDPRFVAPQGVIGQLAISGAPAQGADGSVVFALPVVASDDVVSGLTAYTSGQVITPSTPIKPTPGDDATLVVFTEAKPALTLEPGAPLSGGQVVPIATQTLAWARWVQVAEWEGLAWASPRTATVTFTVQWARSTKYTYDPYYTRVLLNGVEIGRISRTPGYYGMDNLFKLTVAGVVFGAGDVLTFEARVENPTSADRKIASGSADIAWS